MSHDETRLTFHVFHEAWYWRAAKLPDVVYEIEVQRSYLGGGVEWEFSVTWERLGRPELSVCVKVWNDAFRAFTEIPTFFTKLAKLRALTPDECVSWTTVAGLLLSLGFEDVTERTEP